MMNPSGETQEITLSEDQGDAAEILLAAIRAAQRVVTLAGAAGTGKTTLMRHIVEILTGEGWFVFFAAPTGKAAVRLKEVVKRNVNTLHSIVYRRVVEGKAGQPIFKDRNDSLIDMKRKALLICDEASMVGEVIYKDLLHACGDKVQVLFVGDDQQLDPVGSKPGPDLKNPTTRLTKVHRQALENRILAVATEIREGKAMSKVSGGEYERRSGTLLDAARWYVEKKKALEDAVVLCTTNDARSKLNKLARRELEFTGPIAVGEQIIVLLNNRDAGRMNGEIFTVEATSPVLDGNGDETGLHRVLIDGSVYFVHEKAIGADVLDFKKYRAKLSILRNPVAWLHVDYGYAITPWKSQGSEYDSICFVIDRMARWKAAQNPNEARKLAYTAITRGKKHALVLDCP